MSKTNVIIPQFLRTEELERLFQSLIAQTSDQFVISIYDDDSPNIYELELVIKKWRARFDKRGIEMFFYKNESNIGITENSLIGLKSINEEYFMLLANDDEISDNFIDESMKYLNKNVAIGGVIGNWKLISSDRDAVNLKPWHSENPLAMFRVIDFILRGDDTLFYGLYRSSIASKFTYNHNDSIKWGIANWCYVAVINVVASTRISYLPYITWVNHDYGPKAWTGENINPNKRLSKYKSVLTLPWRIINNVNNSLLRRSLKILTPIFIMIILIRYINQRLRVRINPKKRVSGF